MFSIIHFFPTQKKYTADYEDSKDQIYFMQTETPTYASNKNAGHAASSVSFNVCLFLCTHGNKHKSKSEIVSGTVLLNKYRKVKVTVTMLQNKLDYMHRFKLYC